MLSTQVWRLVFGVTSDGIIFTFLIIILLSLVRDNLYIAHGIPVGKIVVFICIKIVRVHFLP
jgi:hypothetical protein